MLNIFLSLGTIALIGFLFRFIFPGTDTMKFRVSINRLVLFVVLPALIFDVIYHAPAGSEFYTIPLAALGGIAAALILALALFRFVALPGKTKGALILGSAFSNVTYLGLPVLLGVFSTIPDKIAVVSILYEVTMSPVLLSVGVLIAIHFGKQDRYQVADYLIRILKLPPLWALAGVLLIKWLHIPVPAFLLQATETLSATAAGLMILSLGMALRFKKPDHPAPMALAVVIQLAFIPLVVFAIGKALSMNQPYFEAAVIEASMPAQLLTLVVADEFGLDTDVLAQTIFSTTVLSMASIPLIRHLLFS
jgi:predicted permease